jgi:hypothetical protein
MDYYLWERERREKVEFQVQLEPSLRRSGEIEIFPCALAAVQCGCGT